MMSKNQRSNDRFFSLYYWWQHTWSRFPTREKRAYHLFRTHTRAFIIYMYIYIYVYYIYYIYIYTYKLYNKMAKMFLRYLFFFYLLANGEHLSFFTVPSSAPVTFTPSPIFPRKTCISIFLYSFLDNLVHLYLYIIYIIDLYSRKVVFNYN